MHILEFKLVAAYNLRLFIICIQMYIHKWKDDIMTQLKQLHPKILYLEFYQVSP